MPSEERVIEIYRAQVRPLYGIVSRRVGGDRALAEDIVQETWLRAVRTWPDKGVPDRPLAWLSRVARNLVVSHFRRIRPEPVDPAELQIEDDRFHPETPEASRLVAWGLARLRRGQAELLEAFHLHDKTTQEIADERGLSVRAVEGRLYRARQALRRRLEPHVRPGTDPDERPDGTRHGNESHEKDDGSTARGDGASTARRGEGSSTRGNEATGTPAANEGGV